MMRRTLRCATCVRRALAVPALCRTESWIPFRASSGPATWAATAGATTPRQDVLEGVAVSAQVAGPEEAPATWAATAGATMPRQDVLEGVAVSSAVPEGAAVALPQPRRRADDLAVVAADAARSAGVTPQIVTVALKTVADTCRALDPSVSFPQAIHLLLKAQHCAPAAAVLEAVAPHVRATTPIRPAYLQILPACADFDMLVHNYDPKQPLTHPLTVLASLCSLFLTVPLLEYPWMEHVAEHFRVPPLQGCERFYMDVADVFVSRLTGEPSCRLEDSVALVLRNLSESGKTFKSLALPAGFDQLIAKRKEQYAVLDGRAVVPLYIGFNCSGPLTNSERSYVESGGEAALRCVLYARIAATATAVERDPTLVAVPEHGGAVSTTLRVSKDALVNLEKLNRTQLEDKAIAAVQRLGETLTSPQGKPPLVVVVVDEGQELDGLAGLPRPSPRQDDTSSVNGGRIALRVCRELQVDRRLQGIPLLGLMLGIDPQTALATQTTGKNIVISGDAELPTFEEFVAFVEHRLPHVSAEVRAIICAVQYPRGRVLPTSLSELFKFVDDKCAQAALTVEAQANLTAAVRASLKKADLILPDDARVTDVPYLGKRPTADFFNMTVLHYRISTASELVPELVPELLRSVAANGQDGHPGHPFEKACGVLLAISAEFVLTRTLGCEIGGAAFEFFDIPHFGKLESLTVEDLSSTGLADHHPLKGTRRLEGTPELSPLFREKLCALSQRSEHAVLFRTGGRAPWDYVLVVNAGGTLHFRYADAKSADKPAAPELSAAAWHRAVLEAVKRAPELSNTRIAEKVVSAVIARVQPTTSLAPHLTLDQDSWKLGAMTDLVFRPEFFAPAPVTTQSLNDQAPPRDD